MPFLLQARKLWKLVLEVERARIEAQDFMKRLDEDVEERLKRSAERRSKWTQKQRTNQT
jgi:hypothetical protein